MSNAEPASVYESVRRLPTQIVNDEGRYHSHLVALRLDPVPKVRFLKVGSDSLGRVTRYPERAWEQASPGLRLSNAPGSGDPHERVVGFR